MSRILQNALSGNHCLIMMDGETVGQVQNIRFNDNLSPDALSGIGSAYVQEYVPTQARFTVTCSQASLRVPHGLTEEALEGVVFDIVVVRDGEIIREAKQCSYDSGGIDINKHAIVYTNATFNALKIV